MNRETFVFSDQNGSFYLQCSHLVDTVKDGAAVFRDIVGCELRTSVKIWESINGGSETIWCQPPSPGHLGQRPTVKKGTMLCDAVSQHKTVDFQIWDMVVLSISLYSLWSVKAVGNLGWIIIWWAEQSPDGEIGKIGLEMTTKNPQFPFSKRLKWRAAACRRFKLPNSFPCMNLWTFHDFAPSWNNFDISAAIWALWQWKSGQFWPFQGALSPRLPLILMLTNSTRLVKSGRMRKMITLNFCPWQRRSRYQQWWFEGH